MLYKQSFLVDWSTEYVSVYKQTKVEAKLGLKGRKLELDYSSMHETPEYKAICSLEHKAEKIIREEYSKVMDLERQKEEISKQKKQLKDVSYIRKVFDRTK